MHLRVNFSQLNEYEFRDGFRSHVQMESGNRNNTPFLLRCRLYFAIRTELLDDIYTVTSCLTNCADEKHLDILLHGSEYFRVKTNQSVLKYTAKFFKSSKRFNDAPFLQNEK